MVIAHRLSTVQSADEVAVVQVRPVRLCWCAPAPVLVRPPGCRSGVRKPLVFQRWRRGVLHTFAGAMQYDMLSLSPVSPVAVHRCHTLRVQSRVLRKRRIYFSRALLATHHFLLQDGLVVERGTHDGLLAAGGVFAALVRRQLLGGGAGGGAASLQGGNGDGVSGADAGLLRESSSRLLSSYGVELDGSDAE